MLGAELLASAELPSERAVTADPRALLAACAAAYRYDVELVPLAQLPRWHVGDALEHDTRRFFSIEGLAIETDFGPVARWTQPIIVQPEIGILGFLAKRIGGALHLLAQAKMEPGNQALVQYSPTVQATPSNYARVHGGRATPYLEHFLGDTRGRVIVDQLQSEQGTRYFRKRNRNMIVLVPDDAEVPLAPDFAWLSLAQLRELLVAGNHVNMNGRSVLATICYAGATSEIRTQDPFRRAVLESHLSGADDDELARVLAWLHDMKSMYRLDARRISLRQLERWICDDESIRHDSGRFFRIVGANVRATSREVTAWAQPMFAPMHPGFVAFICQRRGGVLQFLVQARVEPGFIDRVELGATLQLSPNNYLSETDRPPLAEYLDCPPAWIRLRAPQSEDGGRFYHDDTTNIVIELPEGERVAAPHNYRWVTLGLLKRLAARGYYVDIEARSLMACLM